MLPMHIFLVGMTGEVIHPGPKSGQFGHSFCGYRPTRV